MPSIILGHVQDESQFNFFLYLYTFSIYMLCSVAKSCPWDFPVKNTGVGCHGLLWGSSWPRDRTHVSCISCIGKQILYHCAPWKVLSICASPLIQRSGYQLPSQTSPMCSLEFQLQGRWKKVKVSCPVMSDSLQSHELQPARLLCLWNSLARVVEWAANSFSRVSSRPRDWTWVSCGQILYRLSHQGSLVSRCCCC